MVRNNHTNNHRSEILHFRAYAGFFKYFNVNYINLLYRIQENGINPGYRSLLCERIVYVLE